MVASDNRIEVPEQNSIEESIYHQQQERDVRGRKVMLQTRMTKTDHNTKMTSVSNAAMHANQLTSDEDGIWLGSVPKLKTLTGMVLVLLLQP